MSMIKLELDTDAAEDGREILNVEYDAETARVFAWDLSQPDDEGPEITVQLPRPEPEAPGCIQTSCDYCGHDIENLAPFPAGQWMDRGGNYTCDGTRPHAPTPEEVARHGR